MVSRVSEDEKAEDLILLKTSEGETVYSSSKTWDQLKLSSEMIHALELKNWITPTLIQGITISLINEGHNVVAQSKNGSGKTGSFVVGALSRINKDLPDLQAICVSHTRELTQQNFSVFAEFGERCGITVGQPLKGAPAPACQVLCLTFGSLRNLFRNPSAISNVKVLIYDECDFLFDNDDSRNSIIATQRLIPQAQKLIFSATFNSNVFQFVEAHVENPKIVRIEKKEDLTLDNIDQLVIQCEHSKKFEMVLEVLRSIDLRCCIIFINTKDYLKRLEEFLAKAGYKVSIIASGLVENEERAATIEKVREGQVKVLLTTDVLSRGVDFRLVNLVINIDPPIIKEGETRKADPHTYLHRIGRTGRYGRRGIAVNVVSDKLSQQAFMEISNYFGVPFKKIAIEGLTQEVQKVNADYEI